MIKKIEDGLGDRLIHILLEDGFGAGAKEDETHRDMQEAVLNAAYPSWLAARRLLPAAAALIAVTVASIILLTGGAPAEESYPRPQLTGSYWITSGSADERGMGIATAESKAQMDMGGYVRVSIAPHSRLRLQGQPYHESIRLERGRVTCFVTEDIGQFSLVSGAGSVRATGAQFWAGLIGVDQADELLLRVHSGSVMVDGPGGPVQVVAGKPLLLTTNPEIVPGAVAVDLHPDMTNVQLTHAWARLFTSQPGMLRPIRRSNVAQEGLYAVHVVSRTEEPVAVGPEAGASSQWRNVAMRVRVLKAIVPLDGMACDEMTIWTCVFGDPALRIPPASDTPYLLRVVRASVGDNEKPRCYLRPACGYSSLQVGQDWLVPLPKPDGQLVEAMSELLDRDVDRESTPNILDRVLKGLGSRNQAVSTLSAQFARVQGWRFLPDIPNGTNKFAGAILAMRDEKLRRMLAGAYSEAAWQSHDILPRSQQLLRGLIYHSDFRTAESVLRGGIAALGSDPGRQKAVAPSLGPLLAGGEMLDMRRGALLEGLGTWQAEGLIGLRDELWAIATGLGAHTWPPKHRQQAVQLLKLCGAWDDDQYAIYQ